MLQVLDTPTLRLFESTLAKARFKSSLVNAELAKRTRLFRHRDGDPDPIDREVKHFHRAPEAKAEGERIAKQFHREGGSDLAGMASHLDDFARLRSHSKAEKGAVLSGALKALPLEEQAPFVRLFLERFQDALSYIDILAVVSLEEALEAADRADPWLAALRADRERRGAAQHTSIGKIQIYGEELSPHVADLAAKRVLEYAQTPELEKLLQDEGTLFVMTPSGESISDQRIFYEGLGGHGDPVTDAVAGDPGSSEGENHSRMGAFSERDVLGTIKGQRQFATLDHELTHAFQRMLQQRPGDDAELRSLIGTPSCYPSDPNTWKTGQDVIQAAFQIRKNAERAARDRAFPKAPAVAGFATQYAGMRWQEWITDSVQAFLDPSGAGAAWLAKNDAALYALIAKHYPWAPVLQRKK
jgi:hypothetical protein